jgi:hypothetical protein
MNGISHRQSILSQAERTVCGSETRGGSNTKKRRNKRIRRGRVRRLRNSAQERGEEKGQKGKKRIYKSTEREKINTDENQEEDL